MLDWKEYNLSSPSLNQRSLLQLNIDSTDAVMMGTEHSSEETGYVTTRY